ncbi:MAG TPA: MarR family transcriptional regulator [Pseudonocardia sp.]|nr:MarR family transcriptional regulator [Pseudonocardia sp.]
MTETRWLEAHQQHAWRGYLRMQARLSARMHRELQADAGLSLGDFDVLVALDEAPGQRLRPFELAAALEWEKSRLSHHVRRMEQRELVTREDCEDDGRGAYLVLAPLGAEALTRAAPKHVEIVRRLVFDGLTESQVRTLAEVADAVLARLDDPA